MSMMTTLKLKNKVYSVQDIAKVRDYLLARKYRTDYTLDGVCHIDLLELLEGLLDHFQSICIYQADSVSKDVLEAVHKSDTIIRQTSVVQQYQQKECPQCGNLLTIA